MTLVDAWKNFLRTLKHNPRQEHSGQPLAHWELLEQDHTVQETKPHQMDIWVPKTDYFWKEHLNSNEYGVLRRGGTELPFSHTNNKFYPDQGYFGCRACGLPLYPARTKFDSRTGWPSFGTYLDSHVHIVKDKHSPSKAEVQCARCRSHLGHVFADRNPTRQDPTLYYKERHCINGVAVSHVAEKLPPDVNYKATALKHPDRIFIGRKQVRVYT